MRILLALSTTLALTLSAASAQTSGTPTTDDSTTPAASDPSTTDTSGTETSSTDTTATLQSSLKALLAAGGVVTLVDASGTLVATVNVDGSLTLANGATLSSATGVQVVAKDGGSSLYSLAAKASSNGMLWVTQTNTQGKTLTIPLVAATHREAAAVKAVAGKAHAQSDARSQDAAGTGNSAASSHKPTQAGSTVSAGGQASAAGGSVSGSAQVGAQVSVQLPAIVPPLGKGKGH